MSAVAIIFASSSAVLANYRRGNVHALVGAWMDVASISSALGGSFLSGTFSDNFLYYLYMGVVAGATIMAQSQRRREVRSRFVDFPPRLCYFGSQVKSSLGEEGLHKTG